MAVSVIMRLDGPFDLPLSLAGAASFLPPIDCAPRSLRLAILVSKRPGVIEIRQQSRTPVTIEASATVMMSRPRLKELALWLTSGDLDVRPFYRVAAAHPVMSAIAKRLRGLKPFRPTSLFEMAVIAITEQQLSLAAAFHIRRRLVERFGRPVGDLWIFPAATVIAKAALRDLKTCGLSHQKAKYVRDFARSVVSGELQLDSLKHQGNAEVRERLMKCRGFGAWSVQYFLLRGLGRWDCLPADDVGLRRAIGPYLARRHDLSPEQLERALSPFAPFRGLAAFYLAVDFRLRRPEVRLTGRPAIEAGT